MSNFLLHATSADLISLNEILEVIKMMPFDLAHLDIRERASELQEKWIAPSRKTVEQFSLPENVEQRVKMGEEPILQNMKGVIA